MRRTFVLGLFMLAVCSSTASAQLPLQFSVNGGIAVPLRNDADFLDNGIHVGVGLKFPIIPVQIEGAFDKLSGEGTAEDLKVLSGGVALPFQVTPPLLPVSVYVILGGGLYRQDADNGSVTDFGLNGGAGARIGLGGFGLFAEGRGIVVFSDVNKLTYGTLALGVRL